MLHFHHKEAPAAGPIPPPAGLGLQQGCSVQKISGRLTHRATFAAVPHSALYLRAAACAAAVAL
eukprot:scaffold590_cov75-Phaeocystis_antarctica.AAC.4